MLIQRYATAWCVAGQRCLRRQGQGDCSTQSALLATSSGRWDGDSTRQRGGQEFTHCYASPLSKSEAR